ncbi:MAG: hypothetical protein ACR2PO_21140 [Methyloligellaceae bacterium]
MENPVAKKDLVDSILELRTEAERRLMRNKYFVAIKKLDELLEAIRPLEAQVIDEDAELAADPAELTALTDETRGAEPDTGQSEAIANVAQTDEVAPEPTAEDAVSPEPPVEADEPDQPEVMAETAQPEATLPEPAETYGSFMSTGSVLDEFDQKEEEAVNEDAALFEPEPEPAEEEEAPAPAAEQAETDADFEADEEAEFHPAQSKVQAAE